MAIFNSSSGGSGGSSSQAFLVRAPIGTIVIWSGTADNIPTGWQLCDGTNGTPDLQDKFVLGAGTNHAVGTTGGEENVTLTVEQMPTHSHLITESLITSSSGTYLGFAKGNASGVQSTVTVTTGSSQPHNNMPPYYALCYIMKLVADPADGVTQEELTTALADKQDTLVNGTGTTVLNNGVNINTPVQQIVTQAEFDALPEGDQNKGLWVISDGESGGGSSGSSGEIYSTEETKIGTWIDGKPLYRKCFVITLPTSTGLNQNLINISDLNIDVPVSANGPIKQINGDWQQLNVTQADTNGYVKYGAIGTFYKLNYFRVSLYDSAYTGGATLYLRLEYTKTTDTATQEVTT